MSDYADHSDCIDLRNQTCSRMWFVSDLPDCGLTTMQKMESSFSVPPFPAFPSVTRYVPLGSVELGLGRVCRSIDAREAVSLVIGPPGTGKSLICGLLVDHYRASHEVVVLGETPIDNRAAFLRHLLHHLGADFNSIPEGDLQLALIDRVCGEEAPEGGLLLIVDEAQSLSPEVIEAIRMVTNIMRDGEPRVFAVLCGGVKLDEILVDTSMESFTQRVATRCYLHPMNGEETRRYVTETIRNCGADPDETISDEAIAAVHHACSGVPRLVNQMLTLAIDCAEESEQAQISEQTIDQAWAQLQQLPSPMVEEPKISRHESAIEFGELDDSANFGAWNDAVDPDSVESSSPQDQPSVTDVCGSELTATKQCETGQCETGQCEPGDSQASAAGVENDIEVESATATFVEETVEQESPTSTNGTPTPAALFGHFDHEEEVAVGNGFMPQQPVSPAAPPTNLEAMLHQEIVGISSFADSYDPIDSSPAIDDDSEDTVEFIEAPEKQIEDFINVVEDESDCENADDSNPVLWVSEDDREDRIAEDRLRDDCDILVIEDEIALQRVDAAARVDAQDKTISVDFRAMLAKMRSGN